MGHSLTTIVNGYGPFVLSGVSFDIGNYCTSYVCIKDYLIKELE